VVGGGGKKNILAKTAGGGGPVAHHLFYFGLPASKASTFPVLSGRMARPRFIGGGGKTESCSVFGV